MEKIVKKLTKKQIKEIEKIFANKIYDKKIFPEDCFYKIIINNLSSEIEQGNDLQIGEQIIPIFGINYISSLN